MVLWNGTDLSTKGIVVEKIPTITKGKKRIETYEVEGKNGLLMIDKGTYDSFIVSLSCHFNEVNSIDEIKAFLDGYGTLSIDGTREYEAIVNNKIDFEEVERSGFRKFPLQFLCNPIAHDINSTEKTISASPTTFEISQTANTYPILTIKGSGDVSITFNNITFYLYGLEAAKTYTLDCNAKEIVDQLGNNCSNKMRYNFPYLKPGENTIAYSGTITQFTITYKKAYL